MSSEATVVVGLRINKDNLNYDSSSQGFSADILRGFGPTPGCIQVSTDGTDIDLDQLDTPGLCYLCNLDTVNFVEYGIWEPATSRFYPLGELLPGEQSILRLSRNIRQEYEGTGTGTSAPTNTFRFKANTTSCSVRIEVFDK